MSYGIEIGVLTHCPSYHSIISFASLAEALSALDDDLYQPPPVVGGYAFLVELDDTNCPCLIIEERYSLIKE